MGNERMTEIVRQYGPERIMVNSAADWGISDPLAVPKTAQLMLERGISAEAVHLVTYQNALAAFGQSGQMPESDWLQAPAVDQSQRYAGSSILRGGQVPQSDPSSALIR